MTKYLIEYGDNKALFTCEADHSLDARNLFAAAGFGDETIHSIFACLPVLAIDEVLADNQEDLRLEGESRWISFGGASLQLTQHPESRVIEVEAFLPQREIEEPIDAMTVVLNAFD